MEIFHKILGLTFILILSSSMLYSQEVKSLLIMDKDDHTPIIGAAFIYGLQQGTSDKDGTITIHLLSGYDLKLTHITYGTWEISENFLREAVDGQSFYQSSNSVDLQPVTVIAVRPSMNPVTKHQFDFDDKMSHDGGAILNRVASINSVRKSGAYGFDPVFRGFKYDQLNIVMDGAQGATAACPNRMDPATSQFAPNMIEKVEILKGPYALRFGTGIGGTINFVSSSGFNNSAKQLSGRISAAYEGNGNVRRTEAQAGLHAGPWSLTLLSAFSAGDDYSTGQNLVIQSDFSRGSYGVISGFQKDGHELTFQSFYNRARDVDFPALPMDLRNDDTWMLQFNHKFKPGGEHLRQINTTLYGSWVDHRMDNLLKPLEPRMMDAYTEALTSNYGMRTEGLWNINGRRLYAGADLKVESAEGTRVREFLMGPMTGKILNDNAWQAGKITKTGLFSEIHFPLNTIKVVISGRLELNQATINDPSEEFLKVYEDGNSDQINPSISLGLSKKLDPLNKIGLWIGRAQRSGSLTERYINYFPVGQDPYELLGNPELNPEVNYQVDLTYDLNTDLSSLSVNLFTSYMTDYISSIIDNELSPRLPRSPGVRKYLNIENVFKSGIEADWATKITSEIYNSFSIAYTYAQDLERDEPLPEIAPLDLRWSISGSFINDQLKPEVNIRRVFTQSRISTEFGETETPAFTLVNVGMAYTYHSKFTIRLGIENLFDTAYYEHLNRAVRGTSDPIFARGRSINTSLNVIF